MSEVLSLREVLELPTSASTKISAAMKPGALPEELQEAVARLALMRAKRPEKVWFHSWRLAGGVATISHCTLIAAYLEIFLEKGQLRLLPPAEADEVRARMESELEAQVEDIRRIAEGV